VSQKAASWQMTLGGIHISSEDAENVAAWQARINANHFGGVMGVKTYRAICKYRRRFNDQHDIYSFVVLGHPPPYNASRT
jgi:hypothetical protein